MIKEYKSNLLKEITLNTYFPNILKKNICISIIAFILLNISIINCSAKPTIKNEFKLLLNNAFDQFNLRNTTNDHIFSTDYDNLLTFLAKNNNINNEIHKFNYRTKINKIIRGDRRIDIGKDYLREIINSNDRLNYYDLYIKLAKEKGYIITSYVDYITNYKDTDKKILILRHDIDAPSEATRYMFEIEKKNNVKATYYFRWATFDKELIDELSKQGFEVSLHYETIANYYIKNGKHNISKDDIIKCREILKSEIKTFKEKSGVNIQTISSHGNPINKAIGIPNNVLLIGENYKDYGIISETYNNDIIKYYIKSYICDADILNKYGFSYDSNPIDSIMNGKSVIEFLSHPNHWYYDIDDRVQMYYDMDLDSK